MTLIKNRDIIVVGLQPWDTEIGSNCKNIAIEFSKHNRVLYVNSPLDRITKIKRKNDKDVKKRLAILSGEAEDLELIAPNLWVYYPDVVIESINWIKINFIFDLLNRSNNKLFSNSIVKAVKKLQFKNYLLFNDNDIFRSFYLKDYLKPDSSIYYSRDYLIGVDYWRHHGSRLEPKLMAKSDVCTANSAYLAKLCGLYNPHSYYVGQGCEIDIFLDADQQAVPNDMNTIKAPILGYVGALQSLRLDLELIKYIAEQKPDWNVVLVGPEDGDFAKSGLHKMTNVHFLGSKNPDELPAYVNSFDVCMNPQKVNEVTIGNYPRKIDEYLAVGKPILATRTESMEVFADFVFLADTKEQYLEYLEQARLTDSVDLQKSRKRFAAQHTWEASVREIYKAIKTNNATYNGQ
ncbi:glycosyltransferase [Pedobacter sp. MC2016-14]|uniref:glycosyltransferase n=1 Tax=Pedobacter sp. MC2016-14 TaxID=2897327 RepID=UPI001E37F507|nr:glycosyltransferase [Pedobacter sp. MC2016-14]MCD0490217.1 glycosyltransferase [Pedobacter sp. MC2016-14]